MKPSDLIIACALAASFCGCIASAQTLASVPPATSSDLRTPEEMHLRNIRQLTFGGSNAEAYFSADGKKIIFQSTRDNLQCDQIFIMNADGSDQKMVSTGKGRTTCSYVFPHNDKILYSSTHLADGLARPAPTTRRDMCGRCIRASIFLPRRWMART